MTKDELYNYLRAPHLLDRETLPQLERLVEAYPYAGGIVFLYLYNLHLVEDIRYTAELQRLAIRLPSRELLYGLVEKDTHYQAPEAKTKKSSEGSFALIDQFLDSRAHLETAILPSDEVILATEDYFASYEATTPSQPIPAPLPRQEASNSPAAKPSFAPSDEGWSDTLFTETLARTYAKQGRYDRALEVFEAISSKNSEKSAYFAEQIEYLRLLRDNRKEEQ